MTYLLPMIVLSITDVRRHLLAMKERISNEMDEGNIDNKKGY